MKSIIRTEVVFDWDKLIDSLDSNDNARTKIKEMGKEKCHGTFVEIFKEVLNNEVFAGETEYFTVKYESDLIEDEDIATQDTQETK